MDISTYENGMKKALAYLENEFAALQMGRATTGLVDNLNVETDYGTMKGGNDSLVNMSGHEKFAKRASNVQYINYEDSKHEIYNDVDEVREKYFNDIFTFIMNYAVN